MTSKNLFVVILFFGVSVQARFSNPRLLDQSKETSRVRTEWESYGAYYEIDELFIETGSRGLLFKRPRSRIIVLKRIRILNAEGLNQASPRVPFYSSHIDSFAVTLTNAEGREVALEAWSMEEGYYETGAIIFPHVEIGSVLTVKIVFSLSTAVESFVHTFGADIPVQKGRLTVSSPPELEYDFALYGEIDSIATKEAGDYFYYAWTINDMMPVQSRGNSAALGHARVSVVLRQWFGKQRFYNWESLAHDYERQYLRQSRCTSQSELQLIVDSLSARAENREQLANALYLWVIGNIAHEEGVSMHSRSSRFRPNRIMHMRKGSAAQVAGILDALFREAGFESDIVVTRPSSFGGFDPSFPTPRQMVIPFVRVKVDSIWQAAFPFALGGTVGEYPDDYFNNFALSLSRREVVALPSPQNSCASTTIDYVADISDSAVLCSASFRFEEYSAYLLRNAFFSMNNQEIQAFFQHFIRDWDPGHTLERVSVDSLEQRGAALLAQCIFSNQGLLIGSDSVEHFRLGALFPAHFDSYNQNVHAAYHSSYQRKLVENLKIIAPEGCRLSLALECAELSNALFSSSCESSERGDTLFVSRTTTINRAAVGADEMKALLGAVDKLNRIKEGHCIIRKQPVAESVESPSAD